MNAVRPSIGDDIPANGSNLIWIYLGIIAFPGSVVDSYSPNGSMNWRQYTIDLGQAAKSKSGTLPLYNDGIRIRAVR